MATHQESSCEEFTVNFDPFSGSFNSRDSNETSCQKENLIKQKMSMGSKYFSNTSKSSQKEQDIAQTTESKFELPQNLVKDLHLTLSEWSESNGSHKIYKEEQVRELIVMLQKHSIQDSMILFRKFNKESLLEEKTKKPVTMESEEEEEESDDLAPTQEFNQDSKTETMPSAETKELAEMMEKVVSTLKKRKSNEICTIWCLSLVHDIFSHKNAEWDMLYNQNPVYTIVEILQAQSALEVQAPGVSALCRAITSLPDPSYKFHHIAKSGAVELLLKAMKIFERNTKIHVNCGKALATASMDSSFVPRVKELKLVDTAIRSLIDHRDIPEISGMDSALANWSSWSNTILTTYKSHRVLFLTLERMLKFPKYEHIQKVGCFALNCELSRISRKEGTSRWEQKKELIDADAFFAIFNALKNFPHSERIHYLGIYSIYWASKQSRETARLLHEMKVIETVIDSMKYFTSSIHVQRACCCAIRTLAITKDAKEEFKNRGSMRLIEEAKKKFPRDWFLQEQANSAMSSLKNSIQAMKEYVSRKIRQTMNARYAKPLIVE